MTIAASQSSRATPVDGGRFNAAVDIRPALSEDKRAVETAACLEINGALAEQVGERWAKGCAGHEALCSAQ